MSQQYKIRRAMHRLVQRYLRVTAANASHGYIPLATGPFGVLDESRRLGARQESGFRHVCTVGQSVATTAVSATAAPPGLLAHDRVRRSR